jgi:hypothetical protein
MRPGESVQPFKNTAAGTKTFSLQGGQYMFAFVGTGTGTVDLKMLGPDGATYIPCGLTQITATTGQQVLFLPIGQYEVIIATFTANYVTLVRISQE